MRAEETTPANPGSAWISKNRAGGIRTRDLLNPMEKNAFAALVGIIWHDAAPRKTAGTYAGIYSGIHRLRL